MKVCWRRWLTIGAAYGVVSGMGLVVVAARPDLCADVLGLVFWPHPEAAGAVTDGARLATAVTGALTAGIGAMAWLLRPAATGANDSDARIGSAIAGGMFVWFALDSAASVAFGAWVNVVGNVTFLAALLPPAIALARGHGRRS